jgi:copper chaperone CopZ
MNFHLIIHQKKTIMKSLKYAGILLLAILINSTSLSAQVQKTTLLVAGKCDMCKKRIENASDVRGVKSFTWDVDSHILSLEIDTTKTSVEKIARYISKAGHDNEYYRADEKAFKKLHSCCAYERLEPSKAHVSESK